MQATPIRTDVAREFLAEPAQDVWNPDATIIYDAASLPRPSPEGGDLVDVELTGANRIDERGSWQGAVRDDDLRFKVVPEDGEFRIAGPPNALIVPQSWYEQRFRQVSLYFFDPTSQVLVPDPVFVPRNADLASTLVQRPDRRARHPTSSTTRSTRSRRVPTPRSRSRSPTTASLRWTSSATSRCPGSSTEVSWSPSSPGPCARSRRSRSLSVSRRRGAGHARRPDRGQRDDGRARSRRTSRTPTRSSSVSRTGGWSPAARRASTAVDGPFGQGELVLRSITPDLSASQAAGVDRGRLGDLRRSRPSHHRAGARHAGRHRGHRPAGPGMGLQRPALDGRPPAGGLRRELPARRGHRGDRHRWHHRRRT